MKTGLLFNPRLRGKARDWNWHNVIGFWSSGVLVVLTLTAAVMSYPWANDLLYTLTGSQPPPRAQRTSPMAQAQERSSGGDASERKPLASFDTFLARAEQQAPAWVMMMMRLAPRSNGPVTVLIQEPTAPHIYARSQLALDRLTAKIIKWEPYAGASLGRKARTWRVDFTSARRSVSPAKALPDWHRLAAAFWFGPGSPWPGSASITETAKQIANPQDL